MEYGFLKARKDGVCSSPSFKFKADCAHMFDQVKRNLHGSTECPGTKRDLNHKFVAARWKSVQKAMEDYVEKSIASRKVYMLENNYSFYCRNNLLTEIDGLAKILSNFSISTPHSDPFGPEFRPMVGIHGPTYGAPKAAWKHLGDAMEELLKKRIARWRRELRNDGTTYKPDMSEELMIQTSYNKLWSRIDELVEAISRSDNGNYIPTYNVPSIYPKDFPRYVPIHGDAGSTWKTNDDEGNVQLLSKGFEQLDRGFKRLEKGFERLEKGFDRLDERLERLNWTFEGLGISKPDNGIPPYTIWY